MTEAVMTSDSVDRFKAGMSTNPTEQDKPFFVGSVTKRFLSIDETSELLGLSVFYLRTGIRQGWVPHIKCGCKSMINISKLIEILDEQSVNGYCR